MKSKTDQLRTKLDGQKVLIVRGTNRYRAGRVLPGQAFMARGRITLTIRNTARWANRTVLFATPNQVEVLA